MKRAKRLYALLGVLAVVCVATLIVVQYEQEKEEIRTSGEVVLEVDADAVETLSWENESESLAFHKEDGWVYDGDAAFPVSEDKINELLDVFSSFSAAFIIEDVTDEGQYGLDNPELSVSVTYTPEDSEETAEFTLHISRDPEEREAAENETEENGEEEEITAYARVGDSPILYRIDGDSYKALMAAGYDDLRHHEVLTADFADITGFDITLEGESYAITSDGSGEDKTFYYGEEELDTADLQSALENLSAASFTDEAPDQKEEISLTVHLDNEAHPTVQITLYRYDGEQCLAVIDGTPVSLIPRSSVVDLIEAVNAIVL